MPVDRQHDFFGVCAQCKKSCCQGAKPPLTNDRRRVIEECLRKQKLSVENVFVQAAYTFPKEDAEGYCTFYDKKTKKCRIHPVKPETCVAGPITFDMNKKTRKIEWHLKKETICSLAGRMYRNEKAFHRHLEAAKKEILRIVQQLDPKALQAILMIEEPETFKVGEDDVKEEIIDKLCP